MLNGTGIYCALLTGIVAVDMIDGATVTAASRLSNISDAKIGNRKNMIAD
jgi:hypothetical protein